MPRTAPLSALLPLFLLAAPAAAAEPPLEWPSVVAVTAELVVATSFDRLPENPHTGRFLIVRAEGEVGSSGWTDARLIPRGLFPDGYLEFDLVATPPSPGYRLARLKPVAAAAAIGEIRLHPDTIKGVRVFGARGTVVDREVRP